MFPFLILSWMYIILFFQHPVQSIANSFPCSIKSHSFFMTVRPLDLPLSSVLTLHLDKVQGATQLCIINNVYCSVFERNLVYTFPGELCMRYLILAFMCNFPNPLRPESGVVNWAFLMQQKGTSCSSFLASNSAETQG